MRDDRLFLDDILEAITRIRRCLPSSLANLEADEVVQAAVLRHFHVLTEASRKISESTKTAHPGIPWRKLASFRNIVVHEYFRVQLRTVWDIANAELTDLESQVREALQSINEKSQSKED